MDLVIPWGSCEQWHADGKVKGAICVKSLSGINTLSPSGSGPKITAFVGSSGTSGDVFLEPTVKRWALSQSLRQGREGMGQEKAKEGPPGQTGPCRPGSGGLQSASKRAEGSCVVS